MRIVVLCSSVYSETACATAVRLAESGYVPVGALSLPTVSRETLLRKVAQWGMRDVARYARTKLFSRSSAGQQPALNPYLRPLLESRGRVFRSVSDVAKFYGFPVAIGRDQNSQNSLARLRDWAPDLIVFTGGNILRQPLMQIPRLGVLNVHLALLPEIRGMSSPEWSLLNRVPVGITIHWIDQGIDTGPILRRYEYPEAAQCQSLSDLRNRLIAFGIEKLGDVVVALDRGTISGTPQSQLEKDNQFFVMHEWLRARASERLADSRAASAVGATNA